MLLFKGGPLGHGWIEIEIIKTGGHNVLLTTSSLKLRLTIIGMCLGHLALLLLIHGWVYRKPRARYCPRLQTEPLKSQVVWFASGSFSKSKMGGPCGGPVHIRWVNLVTLWLRHHNMGFFWGRAGRATNRIRQTAKGADLILTCSPMGSNK